MIRPITCLAFLAACGSGLYLYQEKHRVQVLDRKIEQTVRATDQLRDQTRMLSAEWTLLNDPARLRQLADQFLTLKTMAPSQFTSLADLDSRLPPIPPPPAPPDQNTQPDDGPAANVPVAQAEPAPPIKAVEPPRAERNEPAPRPAPVARAEPRPPEPRPAETHQAEPRSAPGRPAVAQAAHPSEAHVAERKAEPRPNEPQQAEARRPLQPRPVIASASVLAPRTSVPAPQPVSGSLLGMAHQSGAVPLPRPVPVNVYQMMGNGGGGGG